MKNILKYEKHFITCMANSKSARESYQTFQNLSSGWEQAKKIQGNSSNVYTYWSHLPLESMGGSKKDRWALCSHSGGDLSLLRIVHGRGRSELGKTPKFTEKKKK